MPTTDPDEEPVAHSDARPIVLFWNKTDIAFADFSVTAGAEAILKARRDPIHLLFSDADRSAPTLIAATAEYLSAGFAGLGDRSSHG